MTSATHETKLAEASIAIFERLAPAVIFLAILMVAGIVGNALILAVYCTRYKASTIRSYVLTMAIADLLACVIGLPGEVLDMRFFYTFPHPSLCRTVRYSKTALTLSSCFVLMTVAIERRAKVCRPLQIRQPWRVKVNIAICAVSAVTLAVPIGVVNGRQTLALPGDDDLKGHSCDADDSYRGSTTQIISSSVVVLGFVICVIIMAFSYIHLFIVLLKHRRQLAKTMAARVPDSKKSENPQAVEFQERVSPSDKDQARREIYTAKDPQAAKDERKKECCEAIEVTPEKVEAKASSRVDPRVKFEQDQTVRKIPSSTTRMMFALTALFVLNYLPIAALLAVRGTDFNLSKRLKVGNVSDAALNAYNIAMRSYYLNVFANPIVYSFFSARFRYECRGLLKEVWASLKDCWTVIWP